MSLYFTLTLDYESLLVYNSMSKIISSPSLEEFPLSFSGLIPMLLLNDATLVSLFCCCFLLRKVSSVTRMCPVSGLGFRD